MRVSPLRLAVKLRDSGRDDKSLLVHCLLPEARLV
jgi:hypothetical protein